MNRLQKFLNLAAIALGLAALSMTANATIVLTPSTEGVISGYGYGPSNCEPSCVATVFGTSATLDLLYKADVGSADSGIFASSYATSFLNSALDPSGALITYAGGDSINCSLCFMAIKDGNGSPGYYFFDLSIWDGLESISLSNFWPQQGAISHVSIWGSTSSNVPEPGTLSLLGLALVSAALMRRRKI